MSKLDSQASQDIAIPYISTISPILNGVKYLEKSLQAFLGQTYTNAEHIYVDGGSTDGTLEMLSDYASRYPGRIRYISEKDRGVGDAVNKGMRLAKGEILAWVDPDDFLEPDALTAVVNFFEANPGAYFVFGKARVWNEDGTRILFYHPTPEWDWQQAIERGHNIVIGAAFYRRQVIKMVGGFNAKGSDYDFWLRVAQKFQLYRIDSLLLNNRQRYDSIMTSRQGEKRKLRMEKLHDDYQLSRQFGGHMLCPLARRYWANVILDMLGLFGTVNYKLMPWLHSHRWFERVWHKIGM